MVRCVRDIWRKIEKLGRYGGYGGLKTWVLYTLGERPKNGAEIMDSIEYMSYGSWRPSPGSIYPMLNKMVEEGLIRKRDDGRYELTEDYEEFGLYHNKPNTVESAIKEIESYVSYLEDMPLEKVRRCEDKIAMLASRLQALKDKMYR